MHRGLPEEGAARQPQRCPDEQEERSQEDENQQQGLAPLVAVPVTVLPSTPTLATVPLSWPNKPACKALVLTVRLLTTLPSPLKLPL